MGEQSPSESAARNTSTVSGGRAAYAKATQQARETAAKKKQRELEEMAITSQEEETGKSIYARSQSGSIIRSASSGRGVTSSYGRGVVDEYRQAYRGTHSAFGKSSDKGPSIPASQNGDDAYAPQAERPQDPIIDSIQTADLSRAARRVAGQGQVGRGQRRFIRTI